MTTPTHPRRRSSPTPGRLAAALGSLALLIAALPMAAAPAAAQAPPRLSARLDTTRVTLGQPFRLRLSVEREAGARTLRPEIGESLGDYAAVAGAAATTDLPDGRQRDDVDIELRAFALDPAPVPAVEVAVVAGGDTTRLRSQPLPITVDSVRDPDEGDRLRAIKPPLAIPGGWPLWLVALLAALAAVLLAWLVHRRRRRPTAAAASGPPAPPPAPVDFAREFARIAAMGLLERGAVKLYYTYLSEVMRRFLEARLRVDALERTTTEIAADLSRADEVDADIAGRIVTFLEAADLVKFAKAEPPDEESRAWPEEGAALVRDVAERRRAREEARARQAAEAAETARRRESAQSPTA